MYTNHKITFTILNLITCFFLVIAIGIGVLVIGIALVFSMASSLFMVIFVIIGVFSGPMASLFVLGLYAPSIKTWVSTI